MIKTLLANSVGAGRSLDSGQKVAARGGRCVESCRVARRSEIWAPVEWLSGGVVWLFVSPWSEKTLCSGNSSPWHQGKRSRGSLGLRGDDSGIRPTVGRITNAPADGPCHVHDLFSGSSSQQLILELGAPSWHGMQSKNT